jgi:hypothetical protein
MKASWVVAGSGTETDASSVRASISSPPECYEALEAIACQKRVSLAWVVRYAAAQHIAGQWPLLRKTET